MIYIETGTEIGAENLAFEECFLLREDIHEPIVMLWRNQSTIVVGAFQNTHEEINQDFVTDQGIGVLRRTSGGGAVYHDLGNLCFSFISEQEDFTNTDYSVFLAPVVKALRGMGLDAQISGRNDLTLAGAKISGSATRLYKNRLLFHGTLLYSTDLSILGKALNVKSDKLTSKGIKSVRSRVTVIAEHLQDPPDILKFKEALKTAFFSGDMREYAVTPDELAAIKTLAREKYSSHDWTYGKNPPAALVNRKRFAGGELVVKLSLEHSKIKEIYFEGDFLGCTAPDALCCLLVGVPYEKGCIGAVLGNVDLSLYFGTISCEEVVSCVMGD